MSLTRLLASDGPIAEYFARRMPHLEEVERRWRRAGPPSVRPAPDVPTDVVGTAFDYRLRYYFTCPPTSTLLAARGADSLRYIQDGEMVVNAFDALAAELDDFCAAQPLPGRALDDEAERWLAEACFALALFEGQFRDGRSENVLCSADAPTSCDDLRSLAPPSAVDDIVALSKVFAGTQSALLGRECRSNPTFTGSPGVGGADGDVVIGATLVEIKTTLRRRPLPRWVYQLAGYALLDYDDDLGLEEVAFYLARVPALLTWPLDEFFSGLAGQQVDVPRLREELREVVTDATRRCG